MSIYCHCDSCLFASPLKLEECDTPKTLTQMLAEVKQEQEEMGFSEDAHRTKRCPGFTTTIYVHSCKNKLDRGESICSHCESEKEKQEDLEDDAVERVYQRQLEIEEQQLLRLGDCDGDR